MCPGCGDPDPYHKESDMSDGKPQWVDRAADKLEGDLKVDYPEKWGNSDFNRRTAKSLSKRWREARWLIMAAAVVAVAAGFLGEWRLIWLAPFVLGIGAYRSMTAMIMAEFLRRSRAAEVASR
jgi:hypothetical protein